MALSPEVWRFIYIGITAAIFLGVRKSSVHLHAATTLAFWQLAAITIYAYGEIETLGRVLAAILFSVLALVIYKVHRHWLFLLFTFLGAVAVGWALLYNHDPYTYKAVLNGIWLTGVISTWISFCSASYQSSH